MWRGHKILKFMIALPFLIRMEKFHHHTMSDFSFMRQTGIDRLIRATVRHLACVTFKRRLESIVFQPHFHPLNRHTECFNCSRFSYERAKRRTKPHFIKRETLHLTLYKCIYTNFTLNNNLSFLLLFHFVSLSLSLFLLFK